MEPFRLAFWMFPEKIKIAFYLLFLLSITLFLVGFYSRLSIWMKGKNNCDKLSGLNKLGLLKLIFLKMFSRDCILAKRVFAQSYLRGFALLGIIWSLILIFLSTVLVTVDHILGTNLITVNNVTFPYYSFLFDIAGFFLLFGLIFALTRRYLFAKNISTFEDWGILLLILMIVITGFLSEGLRLAAWGLTDLTTLESPFGMLVAYLLSSLTNLEVVETINILRITMALHLLFTIFLIAYIPFSSLFHMFAAQITTFISSTRYEGYIHEEN